MKKLLYIAAALCLFASCAKEAPFSANEESGKPFNININFQTKADGSGDEAKPKVNSIRVLVFNADTSDPDGTYGKCVFNEYYPFGFTVSKKTGYYQASLTSRINISSKATKFNVYAVLNEDGYELSSAHGNWSDTAFDPDNGLGLETDLKTLLTEITPGVLEETFTAIYESPVSYSEALKTEPAFLMCAYDGVEFDDDDLKSPDPLVLILDKPSKSRPMAQITIDKITTDANPAGAGTFVSDLAKVFVIGVELDNVPNSFRWNATGNSLGTTGLSSIEVSTANKITDEQGDTYYRRYWPGEVTTEVMVNASVRQETNERLYRTKNDGKTDKWNFPDLLGGDAAFNFTNYYIGETDDNKKKQATSQASWVEYAFLKGDNFIKEDNNLNNCGKLVKVFRKDEMLVNTFTVTGPTTLQADPISGTNLKYSDDNWTVNLGDTYYVPENIQALPASATCLKVTLAVAAPTLNLSAVEGPTYPQPYDFSVSNYQYGLGSVSDFKTTFNDAGLTKEQKAALTAQAQALFEENSHIVWYDELDHEVISDDDHNSYAVYIDGFFRTGTGTGHSVVSNSQVGSVFKWNVPTTGNVHTFIIPINNNMDGSYSVLRNTRYKITLHVTNSVFGDGLLTKSVAAPGIGIRAEVVTEKIEDNE